MQWLFQKLGEGSQYVAQSIYGSENGTSHSNYSWTREASYGRGKIGGVDKHTKGQQAIYIKDLNHKFELLNGE